MAPLRGRIHGSEMEWAVSPRDAATNPAQSNTYEQYRPNIAYYLSKTPHITTSCSGNYFLANGARFYKDIGDHQEYATPEDDSFMGTIANEIASERIMQQILDGAAERGDGTIYENPQRFILNKRVVDDDGQTWGYHESYQADAGTVAINPDSLALVGVHFATRAILAGAGSVTEYGQFLLSQKSAQCSLDFNTSTTGSKPIVNLRSEPLAPYDKWVRIHNTSGDPTMSPWATMMKFATTSLVLRLLEHGESLPELRLRNSLVATAKRVSCDVTFQNHYRLENGKSLTAIEIQRTIARAAGRLAARITLPAEEQWALEEWEKACSDLAENPLRLANRADWAAKYAIIQRQEAKHGAVNMVSRNRSIDKGWDEISERGIGLRFRETCWAQWMPSEELITERMYQPPTTTRANSRSMFINHFSRNKSASVDWHYVQFNTYKINLDDTYQSQNDEVNALIRRHAA